MADTIEEHIGELHKKQEALQIRAKDLTKQLSHAVSARLAKEISPEAFQSRSRSLQQEFKDNQAAEMSVFHELQCYEGPQTNAEK